MEKKYALIMKRAATEKFTPGRIYLQRPDEEPLREETAGAIGTPTYVVRAFYGPVNGQPGSRIVTTKFRERYLAQRGIDLVADDIVNTIHDGAAVPSMAWGPRRFLWEMLQEVARRGGDCVIYMQHSGQEMYVDPSDFAEWVKRCWENPAKALLEPALLLEATPQLEER